MLCGVNEASQCYFLLAGVCHVPQKQKKGFIVWDKKNRRQLEVYSTVYLEIFYSRGA